jgi:hypothetical protein
MQMNNNVGSEIDRSLMDPKFKGYSYVPDDNNFVKQYDSVKKDTWMMPANQTIIVAAAEKQWDISPTVKGPFALKTTVTDQDYFEFNMAGSGLNGIYDVNQLFIFGTISELSGIGANAPHRFGPCLLWFDRIEFRSDTDDVLYRTYDISGNYARFGFLNTVEQAAVYIKWADQFGLTNTFVGFGPAGVANQLGNLETKNWVIPLYGTPIHFIPPALLGFQGANGNFTMRIYLKPLVQMKETAVNAADSFNINPVLRIITEQRGSVGVQDFTQTLAFLERPNTYMATLILHEVRTTGVQAGGGFLPAFGAGALFDFVPGVATNAWCYSFFFVVQDRPALLNAASDYTFLPWFTVTATSNGAGFVFLKGVRDGTQDFINEGTFLQHVTTMSSKMPGNLIANQVMWMMCAGAQFSRGMSNGVIDGYWPFQNNDIFRFRGGSTKVATFAATNRITMFMYVVAKFWADVSRQGTRTQMDY